MLEEIEHESAENLGFVETIMLDVNRTPFEDDIERKRKVNYIYFKYFL